MHYFDSKWGGVVGVLRVRIISFNFHYNGLVNSEEPLKSIVNNVRADRCQGLTRKLNACRFLKYYRSIRGKHVGVYTFDGLSCSWRYIKAMKFVMYCSSLTLMDMKL